MLEAEPGPAPRPRRRWPPLEVEPLAHRRVSRTSTASSSRGETGMIPEATIDPLDMPSIDDVEGRPRGTVADALAGVPRVIKLNGGSRHLDGDGGRAKSLLCVRRGPLVSSTSSPRPGACTCARSTNAPLAADLHEQLPHQRRHPSRPSARYDDLAVDGVAAGVPAEQGAEAQRGRPDPGSPGPRTRRWSGVRPVTGRQSTPAMTANRPDRQAAGGRVRPGLHLELRQPRRRTGPEAPPAGSPVPVSPFAIEARTAVRRRTARAAHFAIRKNDGRIVLREDRPDARDRQWRRWATLTRHKFMSHQQHLDQPRGAA